MDQPIEKPATRIVAETLGKKFNSGWLFSDFNYTFTPGNTYAVTGPNGSGKSTLLNILWGQMPPTEGRLTYEIAGKPIEAYEVFSQLTIAAPYMDLLDEFILAEMVDFHFRLKPLLPGYTTSGVIEEMYLEEATEKFIGNFSSGMKQRLKLGLAFFTDVPAVFLDEPGTNLDDRAFQWYRNLLTTQTKNRIIVIASNNKEEYPQEATVISLADFKSKNR